MRRIWPRIGWFLGFWLLLIFGTSCTVIFREDFIAFMQKASTDPAVKKQISDFWFRYGFLVVKGWHATEYAILTALCAATLRRWRGWNGHKAAFASFVFATLFAASDEWHQTFVPGRDGCIRDVFIDAGGALLATLLLLVEARQNPAS